MEMFTIAALQSQPLGNNRDEDIRINRKEDHLKDGVKSHQSAQYSRSPEARSFHTMTMAMHRARPIMMSPTMYS